MAIQIARGLVPGGSRGAKSKRRGLGRLLSKKQKKDKKTIAESARGDMTNFVVTIILIGTAVVIDLLQLAFLITIIGPIIISVFAFLLFAILLRVSRIKTGGFSLIIRVMTVFLEMTPLGILPIWTVGISILVIKSGLAKARQ